MTTEFQVKIGLFEGPLDLLLDLIEERKMLISDVSITAVADDFLKYLETRESFPTGQAAQFILVASTLLLLKSRSLLPVLSLSNDEEGDIKSLEFRLKLLQFFRDVAKKIGSLPRHIWMGDGARIAEPLFSPSPDMTAASLQEAARRVLVNAPQVSLLPEVEVKSIMSLEDMMKKLEERIERAIHMTFRDFAGKETTSPHELVVGFLAMLELVKRGLVFAKQEHVFGEIEMNYSGEAKAPHYG